MPYFDYCISLLIYFPKTSIQRLANCYYACLYKLFNFKFAGLDNVTINNMLKPYNLFCFEYRFLVRSTTFIYNIVNNNNSPKILQTSLKNRNEICTQYQLRSNSFYIPIVNTKYGDFIFQRFFPKMINCSIRSLIYTSFNIMKLNLLKNIDLYFNNFVNIFDKFNLNIFINYFKKH